MPPSARPAAPTWPRCCATTTCRSPMRSPPTCAWTWERFASAGSCTPNSSPGPSRGPFDAAGFGEREPATALRGGAAGLAGAAAGPVPGQHAPVGAAHPGASAAASLVKHVLNEETLVASTVADGHGEVYTDFALHADGFSRMVLLAGRRAAAAPGAAGAAAAGDRHLPHGRAAGPAGGARGRPRCWAYAERELAELAGGHPRGRPRRGAAAAGPADQAGRAGGKPVRRHAFALFGQRRLLRAGGPAHRRHRRSRAWRACRRIGEFMERRLSPARATCEWATRRQDALSQRVSRISNLLRTRVEIEQQQSSQALLAAMNRRQGLQLKLQATVEGLSVAAITYYIVGPGELPGQGRARPGLAVQRREHGRRRDPRGGARRLVVAAPAARARAARTEPAPPDQRRWPGPGCWRCSAPSPSAARPSSSSWPTATAWTRSR